MPKKTTTVIPPSSGRSRPYAEYPEISTSERCVMHIDQGFAPNMRVPGVCFVSPTMRESLVGDLRKHTGSGPFTVSLRQVANVAGLPGIVKHSVGLPDMHTGYGFSIGNICAVDMDDPTAVVSPGGIGFDINCGVRMLRTNLHVNDIDQEKREELAQAIFDHVPVGVGSQGMLPTNQTVLRDALEHGMDWSIREGYSWAEDKEHCEELGRMLTADPSAVSTRAMQRGLPQLGTLGAGNHFIEVQAVEKIYDTRAARRMGVEEEGQIVVMIHSGSRGFGHQVATDALVVMEQHMAQEKIAVNDPQLACARIGSDTGKAYLASMACAANFAWVNRSAMTFLARQAFAKVFKESPDDLDMQVIYDVSHNIAKREQHMVDGKMKDLLLHRKGATRALPPWHPLVPVDYQCCGQPVLLGGSMGTSSYILLGTDEAMDRSFGSTCHGAGRTSSRTFQRRQTDHRDVIDQMTSQNIAMRVASPNLLMEECADAYKNVDDVVDVCAEVGISRKCVKMKPIAVIKG